MGSREKRSLTPYFDEINNSSCVILFFHAVDVLFNIGFGCGIYSDAFIGLDRWGWGL
jgi:hypothetical protein